MKTFHTWLFYCISLILKTHQAFGFSGRASSPFFDINSIIHHRNLLHTSSPHVASPLFQSRKKETKLYFFRNIFEGDSNKNAEPQNGDVLSSLSIKKSSSSEEVQIESVVNYLSSWTEQIFVIKDGKGIGLTTPVKPIVLVSSGSSDFTAISYFSSKEKQDEKNILTKKEITVSRLEFLKVQSGYASTEKKEKSSDEKKKDKAIKQGGIEFKVVLSESDNKQTTISVEVQRCNMDEEGRTMVKEMSEQAILDVFKKGIQIYNENM